MILHTALWGRISGMSARPIRHRFRFSLGKLSLFVAICPPLLWWGWRFYAACTAPDPVWLQMRLHGTLHMQQRQAEKLGIKGPLDLLRESAARRSTPHGTNTAGDCGSGAGTNGMAVRGRGRGGR